MTRAARTHARPRVGVSQRVDAIPAREEHRDALDVRLGQLLWSLGFLPLPLCSGVAEVPDEAAAYLEALQLDAVVLSGGNDLGEQPGRDALERAALEHAAGHGLPVLGICRGAQMINVHQGGALERREGHAGTRHTVSGSLVGARREVNSYHDHVIPPEGLGAELEVAARAGDGTVEALSHARLPWLGILWHPEREQPPKEDDRRLIDTHLRRTPGGST